MKPKESLYQEVKTHSVIMGVALAIFIFGLFIRCHVIYSWIKQYCGGK